MFNRKILNQILYFIMLPVFAFGMFWFCRFNKSNERPKVVKIIKSDADVGCDLSEKAEIVIKNLILKEIEKHKGLEVVVNAREGKILNSTDKIECKNIDCALNDNNKQIADLKSDNAVIHKTTKNVLLSGPTLGHFHGITIDGQDISYNYSTQTLLTDKEMSYKHQYFFMSAQNSSIDLKNGKIVMAGGVRSVFLNGAAGHNNSD